MWILIAFLNPFLHAYSNILDSYLTNKLFSRKATLIFYATLLNIFFLPFLFIFTGLPELPHAKSTWLFLGLAIINVIYLYPYYKALEHDDTSKVIALFSFGQVFVPMLAYLIVGEVLAPTQYIGVGIIILASIALSFEGTGYLKMNGSFWWMLLCTFILAFEYILYKLAFASVNWITGFSWPVIFSFVIAASLLLLGSTRKDIAKNLPVFIKKIHVFGAEELTTFLGIAAGTYAVSVAPVTIVKAIMSVEPAFVLLYAVVFGKSFPGIFKEEVTRGSIGRKLILFMIMGSGLVLAIA